MALSIIFLSFGKPFIYEGNEFNQTKNNEANSYRSPLKINSIKWDKKLENYDIFTYTRDLIELRKSMKVLRYIHPKDIRRALTFMDDIDDSKILYKLEDKDQIYLVAINANSHRSNIDKNKLDKLFSKKAYKLINIFSKKGINEVEVDNDQGLILEERSVNVYKLGERNGL